MKSRAKLWMRGRVILAAAGLSACSSGSMPDLSPGALVSGGRDPAAEQAALEEFAPVTACPEVQVRDGTQLMVFYEKGKQGDMSAIRFQGTVQKFSRECRTDRATGTTTIRVGVAGRLLSGPNGATGTATLPLRVVVVKNGDELLYSKLHPVEATITEGQPGLTWTKIVEDIAITREQAAGRLVIYVGFDEGDAR